jgi:CRP/FNR family cyclic AMP-dependent transcriptional regulator
MTPSDRERFLARYWLQGIEPDVVADVASRMHLRHLRNGASLYTLGDPPEYLYFVVSGKIRLGGQNARGDDMLLHIVEVGGEVGMLSLLDGKARRQLAHCIGATSLLALSQADFVLLMKRHPALQGRIVQHLCAMVRSVLAFTEDNTLLRLPARLAKRLIVLASLHGTPGAEGIVINLPLTHQDLAKMLGVTRQSVGQIILQWQREGWVQHRYRQFAICDRAALESVIETNAQL